MLLSIFENLINGCLIFQPKDILGFYQQDIIMGH